jgi:hypothetical protein
MFAGSQTGVLIRAAALASERKAGEPFHFGNRVREKGAGLSGGGGELEARRDIGQW